MCSWMKPKHIDDEEEHTISKFILIQFVCSASVLNDVDSKIHIFFVHPSINSWPCVCSLKMVPLLPAQESKAYACFSIISSRSKCNVSFYFDEIIESWSFSHMPP